MFTYDPAQINDGALNQMRFSLGDVFVAEPEKTAYLTDEEILAALSAGSFRRAQLRLVESLLRRFAYEVTTEIKEAKWQLSDRIKFWQDLYRRLKTELSAEEMTGSLKGLRGKNYGAPVFRIGLNDWRAPRCI